MDMFFAENLNFTKVNTEVFFVKKEKLLEEFDLNFKYINKFLKPFVNSERFFFAVTSKFNYNIYE